MKKIISVLLIIFVTAVSMISCGNTEEEPVKETGIKITEEQVRSALSDSEGTLTIDGPSDDVSAITFIVEDINASNLIDKGFTREAVNTLLEDSSKITYGEFKACNAFSAAMSVCGIFEEDSDNFNSSEYTETILSIICDNETKSYENWTVSSIVNVEDDTITITAKKN